jgi:hypothetical protein
MVVAVTVFDEMFFWLVALTALRPSGVLEVLLLSRASCFAVIPDVWLLDENHLSGNP